MVAIQESVPVVPCGLDTFRWSMRNRRPIALVWGEAISLDGLPRNGRGYKEGAAIIEEAIHALWRQAAQAVADRLPGRLPDGTPRGVPVRAKEAIYVRDGRPWPAEDWAAGPLGPVFRGAQ